MRFVTISAGLIAASATCAHATFFSFASDFAADTSWTFSGGGALGAGNIRDQVPVTDLVAFFYDDDNGPLPPNGPFMDFNADMPIRWVASIPVGGGAFVHTYAMDQGAFSFDNILGVPQMTINYSNAVMTVLGGEFSWGATATIQGADNNFGGSVTYTSAFTDAPYGIFTGASIGPDDFAFTITEINTSGVRPLGPAPRGVGIDPQTHLPVEQWFSEGSYSGGAYWVPAPGSLALGLLGLTLARRRR
ncbi:hypothetical protein PHYC_02823 [Phycisphaerales bacterium]|nr:hypothetical protein PHYC_02823 [Phycisphaerales bacterium]